MLTAKEIVCKDKDEIQSYLARMKENAERHGIVLDMIIFHTIRGQGGVGSVLDCVEHAGTITRDFCEKVDFLLKFDSIYKVD